eukprot:CAMPEP_0181252580 /NCGR_PEP_ID=MMETSP1096-20121128/47544_1 /TAXON_ID=156174 ORGANISM="Chrysochromulina ericina, Strain CCMP281" /NCGR_SAMPLE_ID=MMETSP1096 /ASSEMBLY_ACC=CAM_ASM_000453 /LENGTH=65 /DNA_ID=CAMNT_0023350355 /DNA_START=122 /DNA_END=319 /DNA_ORIENTATION=+
MYADHIVQLVPGWVSFMGIPVDLGDLTVRRLAPADHSIDEEGTEPLATCQRVGEEILQIAHVAGH